MKKFLIAGSSLAAVAAAGSASAVDVTLGGSIDMGVEFGVGKASPSDLAIGSAFNKISLSIAAAGTTDAGMKYGGSFTLGTAGELEFNAYDNNGAKALLKKTVAGATDIEAAAFNVSGGGAVAAADIVGVKINSSWRSVGATQTGYALTQAGMGAENVCKLAGIGTVTGTNGSRDLTASGGYLPAQQLTSGTAAASGIAASITTNAGGADAAGTVAAFVDDGSDDFNATVANAAIYMGPFAEVKLQSSSTKMIVGAVCVEGVDASATNYFMDNASKVVTASDASIFIEGGFGKLTLQTGDYAGAVSAVAGAGDQADLDADGLVLVASGVGLLGANPFVAVDLAPGAGANSLEIVTGGNMEFGGVSAAVDVALNSGDVLAIGSWDLGMNYSMGDMALSFATDSSNAWGLSASMAVAGFGVDATFGSDGATDHEKSGISYSVAASTSLNGFGLSLGVDQDMKPTVGLSYALGSLNVYAGYDADDKGGKIGAKLSF
jgi:hypothetical protein